MSACGHQPCGGAGSGSVTTFFVERAVFLTEDVLVVCVPGAFVAAGAVGVPVVGATRFFIAILTGKADASMCGLRFGEQATFGYVIKPTATSAGGLFLLCHRNLTTKDRAAKLGFCGVMTALQHYLTEMPQGPSAGTIRMTMVR